jgi:hypothetical protein
MKMIRLIKKFFVRENELKIKLQQIDIHVKTIKQTKLIPENLNNN